MLGHHTWPHLFSFSVSFTDFWPSGRLVLGLELIAQPKRIQFGISLVVAVMRRHQPLDEDKTPCLFYTEISLVVRRLTCVLSHTTVIYLVYYILVQYVWNGELQVSMGSLRRPLVLRFHRDGTRRC